MLELALQLSNLGITVIPVGTDKRPKVSWKAYQENPPVPEELTQWFEHPKSDTAMAILCGSPSDSIQIIDIDLKYDTTGQFHKQWQSLVAQVDKGLLKRLVIQKTMNNGYHVIYRCDTIHPNQKLAQRKTLEGEETSKGDRIKVLAETRGEGGYFLIEPSPGYTIVQGDITDIPLITEYEQEILLNAARSLDQMPQQEPEPIPSGSDRTPFDAFNDSVTGDTVSDMLQKHGWQEAFRRNETIYFTRPGKSKGISASWNHIPNRFYVFSTSTEFEISHIYKASAVYAMLECGGDFRTAARSLADMGFGDRKNYKKPDKETHYETVNIITAESVRSKLRAFVAGKIHPGYKTGWGSLDSIYTPAKGYLNVVTGVPGHGKTQWMDCLAVNMAKTYDFKWLMFSPESYPHELHVRSFIEIVFGKTLEMSDDYELAFQFVEKHFKFIDGGEEEVSLESIFSTTQQHMMHERVDGLIIDPWNELDDQMPTHLNETQWTAQCLRRTRKFVRRNDLMGFIVAHPTKLPAKKRDDVDGKPQGGRPSYEKPTLYNISGSANWFNKIDNGIVVYRNDDDTTMVDVQKIKNKHYGRPGSTELYFDANANCFCEEPFGKYIKEEGF